MIVLKSDQLCVEFQTLGGALSSIKDKEDVEYLWQGDPTLLEWASTRIIPNMCSVRMIRSFMIRKMVVKKKEKFLDMV